MESFLPLMNEYRIEQRKSDLSVFLFLTANTKTHQTNTYEFSVATRTKCVTHSYPVTRPPFVSHNLGSTESLLLNYVCVPSTVIRPTTDTVPFLFTTCLFRQKITENILFIVLRFFQFQLQFVKNPSSIRKSLRNTAILVHSTL